MNNQSKNGETLIETTPCESVKERVTTVDDKKQIIKIISFVTMGDGVVYQKSKNGNAWFVLNMIAEHKDFILMIQRYLENITSTKITDPNDVHKDGFIRKPLKRLMTKTHPYFTKLRKRIYQGKYKGLSEHYLKLLDAEALAILYMCDGGLYIDKAIGSKKRLKNDSYSVALYLKRLHESDLLLLKKYLKAKLDLDWNINNHYNYKYLRLRNKDLNKFMTLVTPFMCKSFEYKIIRTIDSGIKPDGDTV